MAETRLTDFVIPEVNTSYMAEMTAEKSVLVQSGVMVNNADFQGGAIVCHSNVYADLLKANLVEYLCDRELAFDIPTVNGLRIIVDDDVPIDLGGANDDKYTSYIFAPDAVLLGEGVVQYPLEQFRDELGSSEGIIYRTGCRGM